MARAPARSPAARARRPKLVEPSEPVLTITEAQLEHIVTQAAEQAAEATLRRTLLNFGIDISNPMGIIEAQRDFAHLRGWRRAKDTVVKQGFVYTTTVVVGGILAALYMKYGPAK